MPEESVVVEKIKGLTDLFNEKFDQNKIDHDKILEQTCKTNGRVNRLESWRDKVIGALIIMNLILLPLAFMFLSKLVQ